jgi:hypothetical protein
MMTLKIKALSIAVTVIAAMSMAVSASAQAFEMHTTHQGNAVLTGEQTEQLVLTSSGGQIRCTTAVFEGAIQGEGSQITGQEITLTTTISGCQAFGLAAQPRMNGCKMTITHSNAGHTTAGTAYTDVTGCTAGKQIEVNAGFGGCIFTAGEQTGFSHVVFQNNPGSPEDVNAEMTISGVSYELHGGLCGHPTTVVTNNASLAGKMTFSAYKGQQFEQLTQHNHQFTRLKHNNEKVGFQAT